MNELQFIDVEQAELPVQTIQQTNGLTSLDSLNNLQIGLGSKVMRADTSGLWLGASKFADAPFSVDMLGNLIATSASFPNLVTLTIFKQTAIPTSLAIGDLWFDTDDGNKMYRAASVGATTIASGMWELVAATAISVFAQDAIPTSLAIGDLWYDTNDSNKPYRAASAGADAITAGEWVLVNDLRAADAILKAGSGQTLTGDFSVGATNIKVDGPNKRIIINDGTNDRVLIGYLENGF